VLNVVTDKLRDGCNNVFMYCMHWILLLVFTLFRPVIIGIEVIKSVLYDSHGVIRIVTIVKLVRQVEHII